jgi:hypothetical protein
MLQRLTRTTTTISSETRVAPSACEGALIPPYASRTALLSDALLSDVSPHTSPAEALLKQFRVDPRWGLPDDLVRQIRARDGPNRLKPPKKISSVEILVKQVSNAMAIVLIAASRDLISTFSL